MKADNLNCEELSRINGGNRQETYEMGQYLLTRFPEFFPDPDNMTDMQIHQCLLRKVPNFYGLSEPGDARTNTYNFRGGKMPMNHADFMNYLHQLFD